VARFPWQGKKKDFPSFVCLFIRSHSLLHVAFEVSLEQAIFAPFFFEDYKN